MNGDSNSFRILIIDDNPAIHQDFVKILKTNSSSTLDDLGRKIFGKKIETDSLPAFEIDVATRGKEGVDYVKKALEEGKPYSLAFVDIRMPPGWDGIETIKNIWALDNSVQIVICTAYSDYSWEETVSYLGKTDNLLILKKPFDSIAVRQLACALTMKWKLAEDSKQYTAQLQKQVENRTLSLQKSLSIVQSTFESSSDGILVIDLGDKIVDYNQKVLQMLNVSEEIMSSKSVKKLFNSIKDRIFNPDEFIERMQILRDHPEKVSADLMRLSNGKIYECYSQFHMLNNKIVGRVLAFRDITKRANLEKKLKHQATHDALTGLPNRIKLLEFLRTVIKTANENENQTEFAVLFLDLDRFKLINDSLSHFMGDKLLKVAADRLRALIRKEDMLARLGGDEFVIILMNIFERKHVDDKINKILTAFQEPFDINERKVTLTTSIGVSFYPKDATTIETLLRNADAAMYSAKTLKGNNFRFYSADMSIRNLAILDQESELRSAIKNNEFFIHYQPQIDLRTNTLTAVEALIRWQHPKKGVVLPLEFIPLAEETGLIMPIGEWVMRTACKQNKAWQDAGLPPIRVAVNIATQQCRTLQLVETVKKILDDTQLEAQYLELELTENIIISGHEMIALISELKKLGVRIAVDDFGTGYSSLSYLHKIPLDRLKIDSSFVQRIHTIENDEVIVQAVIEMAKGLNLEVIAEGVETEDQMNFLKKHHCMDAQGFYFSKPLAPSDLEKIMKNPSMISKLMHTTNE